MPIRKEDTGSRGSTDVSNEKNRPMAKYRGWGFGKAVRPETAEPSCPTTFSDIPSNKLGDMMANFSAWREYAQNLYNAEFAASTIKKEEYDYEYNKLTILKGGTKRLKEIKAEVEADEKLHAIRKELTELEVSCEMLSAKIETYGEVISSLSREISRRSALPDKP